MRAVVLGRVANEGTPPAPNIQMFLTLFEVNIFADSVHFSFLCCLQCFFLWLENPWGVDHHISEEPIVEIISTVVNISDVSLVHFLRVPEGIVHKGIDEKAGVVEGEAEFKDTVSFLPDFDEILTLF